MSRACARAILCLCMSLAGCGQDDADEAMRTVPRSASTPPMLVRMDPSLERALAELPSARAHVLTRGVSGPAQVAARAGVRTKTVHARGFMADISRDELRRLAQDARVVSLSLERGGTGHLEQARPLVGLDTVFAQGHAGQGITVALIDTGVDKSHPDLASAVVDEACFCASNCCPGGAPTATGSGSAADDNGHGTHLAGILASAGAQSPRGGAPSAKIVAVKVLDSSGSFCCSSDLVAALDWIAAQHPEVRVVNMSLGLSTLYSGECDAADANTAALAGAAHAVRANGALVVASAGNHAVTGFIAAPACVGSVLSVGAVWDQDVGAQTTYCSDATTAPDQIACFSNASVALDVLAPGAFVESTWPSSMTRVRAGTSEAAALVSACAAAVLSAAPSLSVTALEKVLRDTGVSLLDARVGTSFPRIDCAAAVAAAEALVEQDAGDGTDASIAVDAGVDGAVRDAGSDAGIDAAVRDAAAADASRDDAAMATDAAASLADAGPTVDAARGDAAAQDAQVDAASLVRDAGVVERDSGRAAVGDASAHEHVAHPVEPPTGAGCACSSLAPARRGTSTLVWLVVLCGACWRRSRLRHWQSRR